MLKMTTCKLKHTIAITHTQINTHKHTENQPEVLDLEWFQIMNNSVHLLSLYIRNRKIVNSIKNFFLFRGLINFEPFKDSRRPLRRPLRRTICTNGTKGSISVLFGFLFELQKSSFSLMVRPLSPPPS